MGEVVGLLKCLVGPATAIFNHIFNCEDTIQSLSREMKALKLQCDDVKTKVGKAKREGHKPRAEVVGWIESVDSLEKEINKGENDHEEEGSGMDGFKCLNFYESFHLSRRAAKHREEVKNLHETGNTFVKDDVVIEQGSIRSEDAKKSKRNIQVAIPILLLEILAGLKFHVALSLTLLVGWITMELKGVASEVDRRNFEVAIVILLLAFLLVGLQIEVAISWALLVGWVIVFFGPTKVDC